MLPESKTAQWPNLHLHLHFTGAGYVWYVSELNNLKSESNFIIFKTHLIVKSINRKKNYTKFDVRSYFINNLVATSQSGAAKLKTSGGGKIK